jgi:outer membrane lipoprotein-sorting protein
MFEPLVSRGICYFEKPDKMRWEISSPYSSMLIYNAEQVAKFEVENKKATKLNFGAADIMRKVLQQIISWMQGDFNEANGLYTISILKGSDFIIQLIPKSQAMQQSIQKIELHVVPDTFIMKRVIIKESKDDFIKIEFKNKQENSMLPAGVFDTIHPAVLN